MKIRNHRGTLCFLVLFLLLAGASLALPPAAVDVAGTVRIDPDRGVDSRVDYASLLRFGPWDDRNYRLTLEDLALLAPNEAELSEPIPAFYRVALRRARPDLPRTGPAQYPRSALPVFRQKYHGYLVNGRYYRKTRWIDGRFYLELEGGLDPSAASGTDGVSGETRITSPNGAAESAIKISPADTNRVIAGSNGPNGGQRMHYSTDGGQNWSQVDLPLGGTCCDPAVEWSADGTYAYTVTLGGCFFGCELWFYRSSDGGQSWTDLESLTPGDPRREVTQTDADKEYIHVDKSASSPYKDNIYITWHRSNIMQFAVSSDFGNTFTTRSFSNASEELGIGGDITTDTQGNVYYFWPGVNSRTIRLRKSTNGGSSFGTSIVVANTQASYDFPIPSMETRRAFVYTSADADIGGSYDGSVYVAWTDSTAPTGGDPAGNHAVIRVAYSRDGGSTWAVTNPHETTDTDTVDRWHPWLAVGPDGVVHVVFYDTRRDPSRASVDLFYAYSTDGAQTWSTPERVTSVLSPNIVDGFEFGDYNGMDIVMSQLIAVFTDNRSEDGSSGDSVDVYGANIDPAGGAVCGNGTMDPGESCDGGDLGGQTCIDVGCTGGNLACAADCSSLDQSGCTGCGGAGRIPGAHNVSGAPLQVTKATGSDLTLSWTAACGNGDDYEVYEGTLGDFGSHQRKLCSTGGQTSTTITPAAGGRYFLVVAASAGEEGSYGQGSDGSERAVASDACLPQQIGTCP